MADGTRVRLVPDEVAFEKAMRRQQPLPSQGECEVAKDEGAKHGGERDAAAELQEMMRLDGEAPGLQAQLATEEAMHAREMGSLRNDAEEMAQRARVRHSTPHTSFRGRVHFLHWS